MVDAGVMPGGAGSCPVTNSSFLNAYNYITCPTGKIRMTYPEVAANCKNLNVSCPWSGVGSTVFCICKPCKAVPADEIVVTMSPASVVANVTAEGELPTCRKVTLCATNTQLDPIVVTVHDMYGAQIRSVLGLAAITTVEYQFQDTANSGSAAFISATSSSEDSHGSTIPTWRFTVPTPRIGIHLLLIRVNGKLYAESPLLLETVAPTCPGLFKPSAAGQCVCPASSVPLDDDCNPRYSLLGLLVGLLVGCFLLAFAVTLFLYLRNSAAERAWLIKRSEVLLPSNPPEVLFRGHSYIALKARYRETWCVTGAPRPTQTLIPPSHSSEMSEMSEMTEMNFRGPNFVMQRVGWWGRGPLDDANGAPFPTVPLLVTLSERRVCAQGLPRVLLGMRGC